jgi:hypothetical protein
MIYPSNDLPAEITNMSIAVNYSTATANKIIISITPTAGIISQTSGKLRYIIFNNSNSTIVQR